jgi:hypothetical protein
VILAGINFSFIFFKCKFTISSLFTSTAFILLWVFFTYRRNSFVSF